MRSLAGVYDDANSPSYAATLTIIESKTTSDFDRDPIGSAVLLYFALSSKTKSPHLDLLVDWANALVEERIVKGVFGRTADVEFTAGLFAYYTLTIHRKLKVNVPENAIRDLCSSFATGNSFFSNVAFTAMVLLASADLGASLPWYARMKDWIEAKVLDQSILSDPKTIFFVTLLLKKLDETQTLRKLFRMTYESISESNTPSYDGLYFAWVLWTLKDIDEKLDKAAKIVIKDFVGEILQATERLLSAPKLMAEETSFYGAPLETPPSNILIGLYLGLRNDYYKHTIRVIPEELRVLSRWVTAASSLSIPVMVVSAWLILQVYSGWFASIKRSLLLSGDPAVLGKLLLGSGILLLPGASFLLGLSLFWDITIRGITAPTVLKSDMVTRWKWWASALGIEIVALLLGSLV